MSRQQQENILTTPSVPTSTPTTAPKPEKRKLHLSQDLKNVHPYQDLKSLHPNHDLKGANSFQLK